MIDALMRKALDAGDGDDGSVIGRKYRESRSRAGLIADCLVQLTVDGQLSWVVSDKKDFAQSESGQWMFIVIKHPTISISRYINGTSNTYTVIIFHANKEFMRIFSTVDNFAYNTNSKRLPAMDIYDFVMEGKFRCPRTAHVCGLQGFGHTLDDVCPACEESWATRIPR